MISWIIQAIPAFLIPAFLALALTPFVIKLAHSLNAVDMPNARKVHKEPTPLWGGLTLYLSFLFTVIIFAIIFPDFYETLIKSATKVGLLAIALSTIFLLGIWDDVQPLNPETKFVIQFLVACIIYFAGFKISTVTNPITPNVLNVELINFPLTILWIIGVTNAINLVDGLDGLASGIATIACITIFCVAVLHNQLWNGLIALMLAGSLIGFLRYNFNPASIFLGDSGSLLLGFSLAILSIASSTKFTTGFSILFPIVVLGLPITDTLLSMLRRFLRYYIPTNEETTEKSLSGKLYSIFSADKSHIHHQLLAQGFTHRNTVILLYIVSAVFALGAISLTWIDSLHETIILGVITSTGLFWGLKKLKYREVDIFHNGIFLPLYESILINKNIFQKLLDLAFITLSFWISFYLVHQISPDVIIASEFQTSLVIACIIQLATFWITGLYKKNLHLVGLGDVIKVLKSVGYAIGALAITLLGFLPKLTLSHALFLILDFYFLLSMILGIRFSYHVLKYLFERTTEADSYILIHGVNESGLMLLQQLLNKYNKQLKPLGFLDEDPNLEGTYVNGYPVFGGHWKLPRLWQKQSFDRIFITADKQIQPIIHDRIQSFSEKHGIQVEKIQLDFKDLTVNATS